LVAPEYRTSPLHGCRADQKHSAGRSWIKLLWLTRYAPATLREPPIAEENAILTSRSIARAEELFRDMVRIDCEGALAVYRGEARKHIVNSRVLGRPRFQQKIARYKVAFAAAGERQ